MRQPCSYTLTSSVYITCPQEMGVTLHPAQAHNQSSVPSSCLRVALCGAHKTTTSAGEQTLLPEWQVGKGAHKALDGPQLNCSQRKLKKTSLFPGYKMRVPVGPSSPFGIC